MTRFPEAFTPLPISPKSLGPRINTQEFTGFFRALLPGILVAAGLACSAAAPAWANTDRPANPDPAALQAWRAVMAENPAQESGCFRESYPNLVREKVDCVAGSRKPVDSISRRLTNSALEEVGDTYDYVAETKDKTFWAGGNFLDVSVGSESSVDIDPWDSGTLGANEYALQLNTNNWGTTSACEHHKRCRVWQQFVYVKDCQVSGCDPAGVYIQFWLLNFGPCPDDSWTSYQGVDCAKDSEVMSAPDFPISDLAKLSLHASAHAGGQDCVAVYDDTGAGWGVCAGDGTLDISSVWDKTEFGIFGDSGGSQAQFSFGTRFTQLLQVNDGSGDRPGCLKNDGTTGETSNLTLGKCETGTGGGLFPHIKFTLSDKFSPPPPPTKCGKIFQNQGLTPGHVWASCDDRFTLDMQTDGNLVLYDGPIREQGADALWCTGTQGQDAAFVIMQDDGNLVLYNTSKQAIWASGTNGDGGAFLAIQNDGNLVIYFDGPAVWGSGTCCH